MTSNDQVTSNTLGDTTGGDDILSSLVGEGKKFKTPVDLARGKVEADSFIEKLKEENNALRALIRNADETKRSTEVMQDLLNRVSQSTLGRMNTEGEPKPSEPGPSNQPQSLTSRDVELVYKQMRQKEKEDANEASAMQRLTASYGEQTETFLTKKASELALDVGVLKAMARQSPTAFLNLVGESTNNNRTSNASVKGSINSVAVTDVNGDSGVRNKKYYEKLKKDMGVKSFVMNRNLQVQMHKDMQALGDAFDAA